MLLQGLHLYLWAVTVFMIQLETPPVLLVLSAAGFSSCRIRIMQAPAPMQVPNINFNSPELYSNTGMQATHRISLSISSVLLSSFYCVRNKGSAVFETNHTADTKLYQVLDHAISDQ